VNRQRGLLDADRWAACEALAGFVPGNELRPSQHDFVAFARMCSPTRSFLKNEPFRLQIAVKEVAVRLADDLRMFPWKRCGRGSG